ncbi:MAG: alpha/beta hydrolase [Bacteroidota bacterium]
MLHYESYVRSSKSQWIVFLHGAGGSIQTWKYQVDAFSKHFNVLLIDLRDHGKSKNVIPAHQHYRFQLISSDIYEVLNAQNVRQAHFVTLSFGSVLMQDFATRYPTCVQSVVFSGAIFKGNVFIRLFVHLARFFNLWLPYDKMYSMFSYLLMPRKRNQLARRIYQRQAAKLTPEEYMKWVGLYKEFFRLLDLFYRSNLTFRSLVIMGGDDFVFLKAAKSFSQRQSLTTIVELEGAGHICNIDAWEAFNKHAIDFLLAEKPENENQRPNYSPVPMHSEE